MITRADILKLAKTTGDSYVSIYMPTHRKGQATLTGQDAILLKNLLKKAKADMQATGLTENQISVQLEPAVRHLSDINFWKNQSDGLALFLSADSFDSYRLPFNFKPTVYVGPVFHLLDALPLVKMDKGYYVLTLQLDAVHLYKGNNHELLEVDIAAHVPARLEDVVGYDYKQKSLQFRTPAGGQGGGLFHGHGAGRDDDKQEIQQFFRAIDQGIKPFLQDNPGYPLIVACQENYFSIFKEACTYTHLSENAIAGDPSRLDVDALREKAVEWLKPYLEREKYQHIEAYHRGKGTGRTNTNWREMVASAEAGRIEALFLNKAEDTWTHSIEAEPSKYLKLNLFEAMNHAAIKTIQTNGAVYILDKESMPDDSSPFNALYRY